MTKACLTRLSRSAFLTALCLAACLTLPPAARADSTNAVPDMTLSDTPFDPQQAPWVTPEVRTSMASFNTQFGQGQLTAYVITASPTGIWGVRSAAPGAAVPASLSDMARQALEQCEWFYLMPCYILAMNGKWAKGPDGNFARQPQMLDPDPRRYDYSRVPFVPEADRRTLRDYLYQAGPKAMAITDGGYWTWRGGATLAEALTAALGDCKAGNSNTDCNIYAINNFVVMDFAR